MATPEGTKKYADRFGGSGISEGGFRIFGKTGFTVSKLGFGGYRIHHDSKVNRRSLQEALLSGVNLIDTSSNYSDGGSESLIGRVIHRLMDEHKIDRDELVIVSKAGYVQGKNLSDAKKREQSGRPFPDMVKYMEGCWHCIHPEFLEDQLNKSLERLQIEALEAYLLHNPEYFLADRQSGSADLEESRDEYYRRIESAFAWMEEKVASGKIQSYGVSSNTFPIGNNEFEFTSLERLLEIAQTVSSHHHFHVIQFPFNLLEKGACSVFNQQGDEKSDGERTLVEAARDNNIATLVNRPLNAMAGNIMVRFASFRETDREHIVRDFPGRLDMLVRLEKEFEDQLLGLMPREIPNESFIQAFSAGQQLGKALEHFQTRENWEHVKYNVVLPQVQYFTAHISNSIGSNEQWNNWSEKYVHALMRFIDTVSRHYDNLAAERSKTICTYLDESEEYLTKVKTLSQKSLHLLSSVPGIHCVLVGMRRPEYVRDALAILQEQTIRNAETMLRKINIQV
ncbi:aldo/keto reductase [candidate division KSB1 bacterium]